jgi:hypothetical protein
LEDRSAVDSDTRPKKEEKRKRKRIPIEKKEVKREDLFKDRRDGTTGHRVSLIVDNRPGTGEDLAGRRDNREERIKKLIKKKSRKRSGRPRLSYPVVVVVAKA